MVTNFHAKALELISRPGHQGRHTTSCGENPLIQDLRPSPVPPSDRVQDMSSGAT